MGAEERKEMLFWTREEYTKFSEAMMDKPLSFYAFESALLVWPPGGRAAGSDPGGLRL